MAGVSLAIQAIEQSCCSTVQPQKKRKAYSVWIWIFTFVIYTFYHMSRKPLSIVKSVLHQNCSDLIPEEPTNNTRWCDWPPFDGANHRDIFSLVDSCFLFAYAGAMFLSGFVAERMDLRYFLTIGLISSGFFTATFGFGYVFEIHSLWYYSLSQVLCGFVQSSGWPGVVTIMANWFGKSKRGLIMGIWNSHTSLGNIIGTVIATAFLDSNWGLSFIVPGIITCVTGVFVFFFIIPSPTSLGLPDSNETPNANIQTNYPATDYCVDEDNDEAEYLLHDKETSSKKDDEINNDNSSNIIIIDGCNSQGKPISFIGALRIPGVVEFSLSLFFSKLVSYTFLYWLPNYILHTSTIYDTNASGYISAFFDVGGIIGGIFAGVMNDMTRKPAVVCALLIICAIPMMLVYLMFGGHNLALDIFLLIINGILVNGPYSLITTAVSAELGTHESLQGNSRALATVSAIIDGTGSLGAAIGPVIAGPLSDLSWDYVFYMMIAADVGALLLLPRLVYRETKSFFGRFRSGQSYNTS